MTTTSAITLNKATKFIASVGNKRTVLLVGEPGIGKSTVLKQLAEMFPDYEAVYVDCPTVDLPDVALPEIKNGQVYSRPSALWKLDSSKPKIIMLDELGKANNLTRLILTRLVLERTIGEHPLPNGSIVFATTNRIQDLVGDTLPGHLINRVIFVEVAKPSAEEWIEWASRNDIHPIILSFVKQFPHVLDPAGTEGNVYIYNPKQQNVPFVSPRSLHTASDILKAVDASISAEDMVLVLSGAVGKAAAIDIVNFIQLYHQLPSIEEVAKNPETAKVPDTPAACITMAFSLASAATVDTLDAFMTYMDRLGGEYAYVFARYANMKLKGAVVFAEGFLNWCKNHQWFFE